MTPVAARFMAVFLLIPTLASAQLGGGIGGIGGRTTIGGRGGGMGGGMRPPGGGGGRPQMPEFVKAKDLAKMNVAALLLDDARGLHLTDAQKAQLSALRTTLDERNAGLIAQYDSVRRDFKPPTREDGGMRGGPGGFGGGRRGGGGDDDGDDDRATARRAARDSVRLQMITMLDITQVLLGRRAQDAAEALAIIDESARLRAQERIDEQTARLVDKLPPSPGMPGEQRERARGRRGGDRAADPQ